MSWKIRYSGQADKFLKKNPQLAEGLKDSLHLFIKRINGETVSLDVKRMKGIWDGHVRIRKGDTRIILSVDEHTKIIHIKIINFRGDVYK